MRFSLLVCTSSYEFHPVVKTVALAEQDFSQIDIENMLHTCQSTVSHIANSTIRLKNTKGGLVSKEIKKLDRYL